MSKHNFKYKDNSIKNIITKILKKTIMRKILLCTVLIFLSVAVFSQGLYYGPQVGFSGTTIIEKNELSPVAEKSLKIGYNLGVAAEFEIMSFLYVGTALTFFQKGDRIKDDFGTNKTRIGYVDIPLMVGYKMPIGNVSVSGTIGPYTSIAVAGRWVYHPDDGDEDHTYSSPMEFGEMSYYKRFDTGLTIGAGVDYKNYQIKANYSRGFVDISRSDFATANNSVLNIALTYFLSRNH